MRRSKTGKVDKGEAGDSQSGEEVSLDTSSKGRAEAEFLLKCYDMREAALALMKSYYDHLIGESSHENPNNRIVFRDLQKAIREFNGIV